MNAPSLGKTARHCAEIVGVSCVQIYKYICFYAEILYTHTTKCFVRFILFFIPYIIQTRSSYDYTSALSLSRSFVCMLCIWYSLYFAVYFIIIIIIFFYLGLYVSHPRYRHYEMRYSFAWIAWRLLTPFFVVWLYEFSSSLFSYTPGAYAFTFSLFLYFVFFFLHCFTRSVVFLSYLFPTPKPIFLLCIFIFYFLFDARDYGSFIFIIIIIIFRKCHKRDQVRQLLFFFFVYFIKDFFDLRFFQLIDLMVEERFFLFFCRLDIVWCWNELIKNALMFVGKEDEQIYLSWQSYEDSRMQNIMANIGIYFYCLLSIVSRNNFRDIILVVYVYVERECRYD